MSINDTILVSLANFLEQEANVAANSLAYSELHKTFPGRCGPAIQRIDRMFVAAAVMRHVADFRNDRLFGRDVAKTAVERLRRRQVERQKEFGNQTLPAGEVPNGND